MSGRLKNIHLATDDDDDDLYGGFEEYDASKDVEALENDEALREAVKTSYGQRPHMPTGRAPGTGRKPPLPGTSGVRLKTGAARPVTGLVAADSSTARPMTSVRGAGFQSQEKVTNPNAPPGGGQFYPMEKLPDDTPEEKLKQLEKKVTELVEESARFLSIGNAKKALEKAKDAVRMEYNVVKHRDQHSLGEKNLDLTYFVVFSMAMAFLATGQNSSALNAYLVLIRDKTYTTSGRIRVNMGNIYLTEKNFTQAMKMYRMALDKFPNTHQIMRMKIARNIALVLIKSCRYADAAMHLEGIMSERPNFKAAMNLLLCFYALSDKDKMKQTFLQMLQITLGLGDEDRYYYNEEDHHAVMLHDAIKADSLHQYEEDKKKQAEHCIVTAAKLIAPAIEAKFNVGFDWCVEAVRNSNYANLASELEVTKAVMYLRLKNHRKAIDTLKEFEKKDSNITPGVAINLSFLLYLDGDFAQATDYAAKAVNSDHYNPIALVNRGNCYFAEENYTKAREFYMDAIGVESSCMEALYNLALVQKKLESYAESLKNFMKLNTILPGNPEVQYQIGHLHELMGERQEAYKWFTELQTLVPTDPALLTKLGNMYHADGDTSMAYNCYQEAHRYYPCDIEVIGWLGNYYVTAGTYERAKPFFSHAAALQPNIARWQLMVASCLRRCGEYQEAIDQYKATHQQFPENIDCLRYLTRVLSDMNLDEAEEYAERLDKLERLEERRRQRKLRQEGEQRRPSQDDARQAHRSGRRRRGSGADDGDEADEQAERGSRRRRQRAQQELAEEDDDESAAQLPRQGEIDASFTDPLQGLPERPKTGVRRGPAREEELGFGDADLDDSLLPQ